MNKNLTWNCASFDLNDLKRYRQKSDNKKIEGKKIFTRNLQLSHHEIQAMWPCGKVIFARVPLSELQRNIKDPPNKQEAYLLQLIVWRAKQQQITFKIVEQKENTKARHHHG
jgi:hypothetical protein